MKAINLSDLKVGDQLLDTNDYGYGHYIRRFVVEITTTKAGRFKVQISQVYVSPEGVENEPKIGPMFNGATKGNWPVVIEK